LLENRRSRRTFDEESVIDLPVLSGLLWAAQGITDRHGEHSFRTAPSAGALYPVETYLSIRRVAGLRAGIYHFRPLSFDLEFLRDRDHSRDLAAAALRQAMVMSAQVTFVWSAVVGRCRWKYRQRAYRYIYLDAGHVAQNLALAAEAYGLGCCMVGAFYDDHVNALLGIDGTEETVLYMAAVGRVASR
jgi:SagB-type dehydrogenase family enzyme